MLKIRLKRVGRKHDPSFRIVVTEKHLGPKSGKYIESVGFYNVQKGDKQLDGGRIKYWISKGAQVSPTVHNMLISEGVIEGKKVNVLPKKKPILKEVPVEEKKEVPVAVETPTPTEAPVEEAPAVEEQPIAEPVAEEDVAEEIPTEEAPVVEPVAEEEVVAEE
ncbi:30S ribosomal protein S16 [Candidatus Campbellbacteria bacterium CG22_combo_CG10-13_8_21_14_all_36_13]|uniref:Small ribosomal subunit protein bS16 n=1 Tax=Candidatus Campbellbacteria bacterium CG22_combo_CG10-13_8_21_14_all_36_13 TaxID=1974529 RepID=A0A2H0DXC6_9BACT|nr:MAG: 30S ribosomal protein S16 [Candidatus Campbellbacteria bacterium CG22_combo_CG10-13_8_21_14_all_36_13]